MDRLTRVSNAAVLVRGGPLGAREKREASSRAAVARCTPQNVDAAVAGSAGQEVQAVRNLRRAEPDLTLLDAVTLVRGRR